MKLVVLCSGNGSNFENILRSCWKHEVVGMIHNTKDCYARIRANKFGIPSCYIKHKDEDTMIDCINMVKPDLVVLAGYMRVLSEKVINSVPKMINIHPSLLPNYKGLHAIERALESGDDATGVTVHYVTPELDSGDIIIQNTVPILQDDTVESLTKRIQRMEHSIMPVAIDKALSDS
jgi:formyltetrahydrofolate-dependent phosphoribosylglycinamide formyltransferase